MSNKIPTSGAELAELLADDNKVKALIKDGEFADVIKAYASHVKKSDSDFKAQIDEQIQAGLADFMKENGYAKGNAPKGEAVLNSKVENRGGALRSTKAAGAQFSKDFDGLADYFQTIWHNVYQTDEVRNKQRALRNAASTTDPAGGGFIVPESLRSELQRVSLETAVVRPRARVIPMETSRVSFPMIDSTSNVSSVYGGIATYWTEEGAALTESEPTFAQVVLDAKKLTAYTLVNNELLTDSAPSFEALASQLFPEALTHAEDYAFLNGDGVGKPFGVYNSPAVVAVDRNTNNTIKYVDVVNMYARMLPGSHGRAVWVASPETFPQLAQMLIDTGVAGWLPEGNVANTPPLTLLGRPLIISEKAGQLGAVNDLSFIDFGYYLVGDRMNMTASSSPHYKFQNDQTAFKIVSRVDGRPWLQSAITPANGGDTLTPFVTLAA